MTFHPLNLRGTCLRLVKISSNKIFDVSQGTYLNFFQKHCKIGPDFYLIEFSFNISMARLKQNILTMVTYLCVYISEHHTSRNLSGAFHVFYIVVNLGSRTADRGFLGMSHTSFLTGWDLLFHYINFTYIKQASQSDRGTRKLWMAHRWRMNKELVAAFKVIFFDWFYRRRREN